MEQIEQMPQNTDSLQVLQSKIEAILFAAGYPVSYDKLAQSLSLTVGAVKKAVSSMKEFYQDAQTSRGIELLTFDTACQLCTKAEYEEIIRNVLCIKRGAGNLSNASLEVLAIIAYHQPVTRAYIEQIRGVDSSYHVSALTDKGLIEAKGRLDVPGKPILYGTTKAFLRAFGISQVSQLPSLDLFAAAAQELHGEHEQLQLELQETVSTEDALEAIPEA